MEDKILYRNEWYIVSEYYDKHVVREDEIGNQFDILNKEIQAPTAKYYA